MNHNFQDLRTAREMLKRKPLQIKGKIFSKMRGTAVAYIGAKWLILNDKILPKSLAKFAASAVE